MPSYLKEARVKFGYSIEDISERLKIRKTYILALEEGDFKKIPGEIYAKGYLKLYEDYLGIGKSRQAENNNLPKPVRDIIVDHCNSTSHKNFPLISGLMLVLVIIIYYVVLIPGQF